MAFPVAAALGAVGSIFGGLFGGSKPQTVTNTVDYQKMVREAEAAGFNPLTALRNGGAAGFSTSTTPALSLGTRIGNALTGVGNFLADFDPMADQKRELEAQLVGAQIANLNASTANLMNLGSFNVPQGAGASVRAGGAELSASGALPASAAAPEGTTVTNPWPVWSGVQRSPWSHNAEAWENAYGEHLGSLAGTAVEGTQDLFWNLAVRPALAGRDVLSAWGYQPPTKPRGTVNTKYFVPWAR